jgi:cephalosporin hydroxylase
MTSDWPKRLSVDFEAATVTVETGDGPPETLALDSPQAFDAVAAAYLRAGWDNKYVYSFSWLGRPIIQLPDDAFRLQELICAVAPDVIVETGIAHGGSAVFYASICAALGRGRIVSADIDIRAHNRAALDAHPLRPLITLIEGSSTAPETVAAIRAAIAPGERVLVFLDSNHGRDHVLAELAAYAPLVSPGSYIVAMDGIMRHLEGAPRSKPGWRTDNPAEAARRFAAEHPEFELVEPPIPFNEGNVRRRVSYCPDAFLRRRD